MQGYGLDMLMRMAYQRQREPQEAVNRLAESLGNVMAQRGQGAFRQDAVNWFADGEVTADKIQKFQSMYPNVDPQEVLKIAGAAASQKKAQRMKDVGAQLIQSIRDNGGEINQDIIGKVLQNANPSDVPEIMQLIKGSGDVWKSLKQETYKLEPGEVVVSPNKKSIGGQDVIAKGGDKPPERPYKIGQIIQYKDANGRDMQGTVAGYSADGKVQWTDVKDVTKPEKPEKEPAETHVDMGDRVEFYKDGKLVRTVKKGMSPGSVPTSEEAASKDQEKLSKAQIMAGRDMAMRYVKDELGGIWSKDGKQIPNEQIEREYQDLVKRYYSQASGKPSPVAGGPSSYINKVLKK